MIDKIKTCNSVNGEKIDFFELKNKDAKENIFILGVFHGDEVEGEYAINKFMVEINNSGITSPYNLYFLPCLNPDGKKLKTRTNFNKIDLNRNYPTQNFKSTSKHLNGDVFDAGSQPASEPETNFMISLVEEYNPVKILSIHSDLHLIDFDGPAKELAMTIAEITGYRFVENIGYPIFGSFGTWAGVEKQIPLITLETWGAKSDTDLETIWQEIKPAMYEFCK